MRRSYWKTCTTLAAVTLAVVSCSDGSNPAAPQTPVDLTTLTLARCAPDTAGTASAIIGRDGGTISLGRHSFVVPRRSLKDEVEITMQVGTDSLSSVTFFPEGLEFKKSKPAILTLSYSGCEFGEDSTTASVRNGTSASVHDDHEDDDDDDHSGHGNGHAPQSTGIVYIDGNRTVLEYLPSAIDSTAHTVTAEVEHFSRYAVAW